MKSKTIKSVISKKMKEWWDSIDDPSLRENLKENTIVTGGCIASMLLKETINDFDVYFKNKETAKCAAIYYLDKFNKNNQKLIQIEDKDDRLKIMVVSSGIISDKDSALALSESEDSYEKQQESALSVIDDKQYKPIFLSTNAITLSNKIQLIFRFYGNPEEIHKNYDFIHCTNYWKSWDEELILHKDALESLLSKELRYVGSKYPVCSVFRLRKFLKRNWTINAGQILKMAFQISELNLSDLEVMEDQLTGVDTAYFLHLIAELKEKDPTKVNSSYLIEILDRMF